MPYIIDNKKAGRSYKCCIGHPQGRALRIVQTQLLAATENYLTSRHAVAIAGEDYKILALRHLSAIYALVAVKRDLQRTI